MMGGFTQIFLSLAFNLSLVLNNDKEITSRLGREFNHYSDNTKLLTSEAQGS